MSLCTDPTRSGHIPLTGGDVWCSIQKKLCRETRCLHGHNCKSSPKAMAPYIKFGSISLPRDHTALKQSDLYCQDKNSILLEEHWWEAIGGNLCCHRMALVQQGMLVGQRCPEPLSTARQVLPGAHHPQHHRPLNGSLCWS